MLVYRLDLDALMDAPCGGMTWMPVVLERVWTKKPSFLYYGEECSQQSPRPPRTGFLHYRGSLQLPRSYKQLSPRCCRS